MARRRANLPDEEDLRELQNQFRQRQRVPRDPARWNNLLANLMARRGYGQLESVAAVEEAWTAAVGSELAGQTRLGKIQRGVLQVFVKSSRVDSGIDISQAKTGGGADAAIAGPQDPRPASPSGCPRLTTRTETSWTTPWPMKHVPTKRNHCPCRPSGSASPGGEA